VCEVLQHDVGDCRLFGRAERRRGEGPRTWQDAGVGSECREAGSAGVAEEHKEGRRVRREEPTTERLDEHPPSCSHAIPLAEFHCVLRSFSSSVVDDRLSGFAAVTGLSIVRR